jgi:V/A-type H+-transporting ATPase subunit E
MSETQDTKALADALLARAHRLAEEERLLAEHERERLLNAARQRVEQRRRQAENAAELQADRHYRQMVQREELDIRAKLEKLRWTLIQSVLAELTDTLDQLHADPQQYRALLLNLLREACSTMQGDGLVAQLNNRDHSTFQQEWTQLLSEAGCRHTVELSEERCDCNGGVLLRNDADDVRFDNTFEARLERLRPIIEQRVDEALFGRRENTEVSLHAG